MGIAIEKKLTEAGYIMLGDKESIEQLILNILKTRNIRYLKAIPFLIYKHRPDTRKILQYSKTKNIKELFKAIIAITILLFKEFNLAPLENLYEDVKGFNKTLATIGLDYEEFKEEFELQLRKELKPSLLIEKQRIYAERDLQMYLSQLFTKKEKQIIRRLLEEKPISRTDYEYYSRKTKKKFKSIIGLQDFAKTFYNKTPKYDEDLYNLKKKLEKWLEKNSKGKEISILKFFLWENDKISISYYKKDKLYSKNQLFNTIIKINQINDKELLKLLHKYKKHDFK